VLIGLVVRHCRRRASASPDFSAWPYVRTLFGVTTPFHFERPDVQRRGDHRDE
jgi:hypothetical protein